MKINTELNNIAGSSKGSVKDLFKQYNRVIAKNFGAQLESFKGTAFERSLATLVAYGQKMGANLAANLVKDVQRGKQPGPRANSMVTGDILQSRLSEENAISLAEEIRKALPENCAEEIVDDFIKGLLTSSIEVKSQKSDVTTESVSIQITDKLSVKIDELRISAKAWNNAQWSWFSNFGETDVLNGIRRSGATGDFILSVARNINPSDHTIAKQMIAADIILGYGQKSFGGDANFVIIRDQSQSGTNNMIRVISAQEIINRISAIGQREDGIIGYYPNLWIKESTVALSLSAMAATKVKIASNFLVDKV